LQCLSDNASAFLIRILRNRTGIDDYNIGSILKIDFGISGIPELPTNGRSFCKIQFAAKSIKGYG
jgi:hypothetical protein